VGGDAAEAREIITVEVGGKRIDVSLPARLGAPRAQRRRPPRERRRPTHSTSGAALVAPMQGTIVKVAVVEGQAVEAGEVVVVLEAMKMEQPLVAHKSGTVLRLSVAAGDAVASGEPVCEIVDTEGPA
jgi:acetyl-CoA/propionyl-CoA carboxylase biotin carboxyl carrier protein